MFKELAIVRARIYSVIPILKKTGHFRVFKQGSLYLLDSEVLTTVEIEQNLGRKHPVNCGSKLTLHCLKHTKIPRFF